MNQNFDAYRSKDEYICIPFVECLFECLNKNYAKTYPCKKSLFINLRGFCVTLRQ